MKRFINIIKYGFLLLLTGSMHAQFVGTPYIVPIDNGLLLDKVGVTPSFAFSTRKLRAAYTGPALRLRRSTDNSQVDVRFDTNGVVSGNSLVSVSVVGTSSLTVGQSLTLSDYIGTAQLYVTVWWDQGTNYYNGQQSNTARQPLFTLNSAGASNQYASLQFTGTLKHNVTVNQTLNTLLTSGIRGSIFLNAKVQNGTSTNNSFGHSDTADNNIRWSAHMNWPDGTNQTYTDFGSMEGTRNFTNDANVGLNKYKQYTMIRLSSSKIVRVSGVDKNNTNLSLTSRTWKANSTFGVGLTTGSLDVSFSQNGFTGNMSEFVLFNTDLTAAQFQLLEQNQLSFWGSY